MDSETTFETITTGELRLRPRALVVRDSDPGGLSARVAAAGGRVLRTFADGSLMIELPLGVAPADVGVDEVAERRLSTDARAVTTTWRPVALAS